MRKINPVTRLVIFFLGLMLPCLVLAGRVKAVDYPVAQGFVSDYAGVFTPQFRDSLETVLAGYDNDTTNEIAVVVIRSLDGVDIESYAEGLFQAWNIGKKDKDNGLLILVAVEDREMRIEVGYGLEPYINDGRAGEIIRNILAPAFKDGRFEEGVLSAVNKIKEYIDNEDIAPPVATTAGEFPFYLIFIGGYILFVYLGSFLGRSKEIWPGGLIGGLVGSLGGYLIMAGAGIVLGLFGGAIVGLILDWLLSKNYKERLKKGLPTNFWSSGGGFSGGGWSSGRSGGGGFGGFGGGSSGGGGASGKW